MGPDAVVDPRPPLTTLGTMPARPRAGRATNGCGAGIRRRESYRCGRSTMDAPWCGAGSRRPANWCARRRGSGRGCCSTGSTICGTSAGGLGSEGTAGALVSYRELDGPGTLRYLVSADDGRTLAAAVLEGASRRLGRRIGHSARSGKGRRTRAAAGGAVPGGDRANLFPRPLVRPTAPDAVRSGDHGARSRTRSHLHGRGARPLGRDGSAGGARRRGCRRGRSDPPAGGEGESGGSGRDREPQPARVRPAVPGSPRAHSGSAARARADRAAGIATARGPARDCRAARTPGAACASSRRAAS